MRQLSLAVVGTYCLCLLPACGKPAYEGPERASVKGKVTLDDQPVEEGTIELISEAEDLRNCGGVIKNGEYSIPVEKGPNIGKYRVEISWPKKTGKQIPVPGDEPNMMDETEEAIPPDYNTDTVLELDVQSGENVKDFELKSQT